MNSIPGESNSQSQQAAANGSAAHCWSWTLEKSIPNDAAAGKSVLDEVISRLESDAWEQKDIFGIHLAVEEALVNAMKHGNRFDAAKSVSVLCHTSPQRMRIEIEDEGPGFDPDDVPDCTDDENLEMASGRGVMLMRSFMSHVEFNDRGNRVIMEKQRG